MWSRKDLKASAKISLKRNYWRAVLTALIFTVILGGTAGGSAPAHKDTLNKETFDQLTQQSGISAGFILSTVAVIVLMAIVVAFVISLLLRPFAVGVHKFFVECKDDTPDVGKCLMTCKGSWLHVGFIMFLSTLFISLWFILFVIPGVIKSYEYRMIPYLLAENPQMSRKEAFAKSREMMKGQKWNAFVLDISFLGWEILSGCTCGILNVFYVGPYRYLTNAELYLALKNKIA